MMHAAKLSCPRLRRVLTLLTERTDGATSMEIIQKCDVVAPATVVSELRHSGVKIDCKREGKVWRYRLVV